MPNRGRDSVNSSRALLAPDERSVALALNAGAASLAVTLFSANTDAHLIGGSLLILILTFGSALVQDWEIAGLQLIYALVYAVLLFLLSYNEYSADAVISRK